MKIKRLFVAAALALALSAGANAQDDWEFGVKGGVALNFMPCTTVNPGDQVTANVGFQGGAFATCYLTDSFVGQIELLYSRKGVGTINNTILKDPDLFSHNIHYLQIPVLFGVTSLADDRMKVLVGPELNMCLGHKVIGNHLNPFINEPCQFNLGLGVQSTFFLTDALGIDLKFDFGLTRTFKEETKDKGHNAAIQLGLSYRFGY